MLGSAVLGSAVPCCAPHVGLSRTDGDSSVLCLTFAGLCNICCSSVLRNDVDDVDGVDDVAALSPEQGHPDNVAPVIYGGCQLGIHNHQRWITERVHLPPGIQVRRPALLWMFPDIVLTLLSPDTVFGLRQHCSSLSRVLS